MPAATRQATPGPSTTTMETQNLSPNKKKRSGSEVVEDGRDTKKMRVDDQPAPNGKDKKKKKKKKKKRMPVVVQVRDTLDQRPRSKSKSAPLSSSKQAPVNGTMNGAEEDEDHSDTEPSPQSSNTGKGRGRDEPLRQSPPLPVATPPSHTGQPVASGSGASHAASSDSFAHALEIARLKEQLEEKSKLLERHQTHLNNHHQALTCQICLDLLHRPYTLTPCGHITCYGCLVRWFTAPQNPHEAGGANGPPQAEQEQGDDIEAILSNAPARRGNYLRRRKTCPVCRATVLNRPVEIWGIKSMVASLVRSGLVDVPAPSVPPPAAEGAANANNDPWRNIFLNADARPNPRHPFLPPIFEHAPPPQDDGDREQVGWYDAEDGGIYRCIECYHEIWEGVCSGCNRAYPGHDRGDDDDDGVDFDEFDDDDEGAPGFMADVGRYMEALAELDDEEDEDYDMGHREPEDHIWDLDPDEDEDEGPHPPHLWGEPIGLTDSEEDEEYHLHVEAVRDRPGNNFDPLRNPPYRRNYNGIARIEEIHDDEEEEEDDDEEDSQYGGSFIDDEHDSEHQNPSDDDDQEIDFAPERAIIVGEPPRRYLAAVIDISDDDEDEDEDVQPLRPRPVGNIRRARVIADDDENSETPPEDEAASRDVSPAPRRCTIHRRLALPSDDED